MKRYIVAVAAALTVGSATLLSGGTAHAAARDLAPCLYADKTYAHGSVIEFDRYDLKCNNGEWIQVNKPGGAQ